MKAKTLMIQGTSSSVGKSVIVAALCRIFRQEGYCVAPFKAQNMALNSFVTPDGGEIGRAQAVQAEAAGVSPRVEMNPILLKPESGGRSQVVVLGRPSSSLTAKDYYQRKAELWSIVCSSLERLARDYDIIVIEGAGSPAEVNLKDNDIVNMRVAKHAAAPVVLVGDVDKGGVFAALVGTLELLDRDERDLVSGFIINKFRGDLSLLKPGLDFLEDRTGKRVIGVVPYFRDIWVAEEDSVYLDTRVDAGAGDAAVDVAVIWLPHIANYDDFDPLQQEAGVRVRFVREPERIGAPDVVIIPGTKSTMADLRFLRQTGLDKVIISLANAGTPIIGICGGYQILGSEIRDPFFVEDRDERMNGLGLLPIVTIFEPEKTTRQVRGKIIGDQGILSGCKGAVVVGYEIHMGATVANGITPVIEVNDLDGSVRLDGASDHRGLVFGTYIHGLFDSTEFRRALLRAIAALNGKELEFTKPLPSREHQYNKLANLVRESIDLDFLKRICGL